MVKICGRFRLWWFSKHWLCRDTSAKRLPYFRQYSAAVGRVAASSGQQVGGCVDPQKVAAGCRLPQCLASYVQAVRLHPLGTALPFPRKRKKIFPRFRGDKSLRAWVSAAGVRFKIFTPYPPQQGGCSLAVRFRRCIQWQAVCIGAAVLLLGSCCAFVLLCPLLL